MNAYRAFKRTRAQLCAIAVFGSVLAGNCLAGVKDSTFVISPDRKHVVFELREVSRREILERLFAGDTVEFAWIDLSLADESITGSFRGNPNAILERLLNGLDFVIVHNPQGISRVSILGRSRANGIVPPGGATSPVVRLPQVPKEPPTAPASAPQMPLSLMPGKPTMPITAPAPGQSQLMPVQPAPGQSPSMTVQPPPSASIFPILAPAAGVRSPTPQ